MRRRTLLTTKETTMTDGPRQPPVTHASPDPVTDRAPGAPENGRQTYALWQEAQERLLLYLKALGVPPFQSLDITRQALRTVIKERQAGCTEAPTKMAMRALHDILARDHQPLEQATHKSYPILYRRWRSANAAAAAPPRIAREPMAAPPIVRSAMPIKKIRHLSILSPIAGMFHREK